MEVKSKKTVAIIILNWNSYTDTFECLKSLEKLNYPSFKIYLVDNDSHDNSFKQLISDNKEGKFNLNISFLQTGSNLGFAGGNNYAIREAYRHGFDYYWLLNNDTVVDKNSLYELIKVIEGDKSIGIVGSKILYFDSNEIWFAGGEINKITGATKHIGFRERDLGQYDVIKQVDYITGCSLLFRSSLLEKTGYMEEDYFLYYEETDWNIRAKLDGFKVLYVPMSIVFHKVSSSSGGDTNKAPFIDYYFLRNRLVMTKRNKKIFYLAFCNLFIYFEALKSILKVLLRYKNNKRERFLYIFKGIKDGKRESMGLHPKI